MWFAALGSYQSNPWLVNLCFRILSHEPDVLALLDTSRLPFPIDSPPKYIRISRYNYAFTKLGDGSQAWWTEKTNRQAYMAVVNRDTIKDALKLEELKLKVPGWVEKLSIDEKRRFPFVKIILDVIHKTVVSQSFLLPHHIMWIVFALCFFLQMRRCSQVAAERKLQAER